MGFVMVYGSRKIVVGYAEMHNGCSVVHYGLFKNVRNLPLSEEGFLHFVRSSFIEDCWRTVAQNVGLTAKIYVC